MTATDPWLHEMITRLGCPAAVIADSSSRPWLAEIHQHCHLDYEPPPNGGSLNLALASPRLIVRYDSIDVDVVTFHDRDGGGAYGVQRRIFVALNDLGWDTGEATEAGDLLIGGTSHPALTAPARRCRPSVRARLRWLKRTVCCLPRAAFPRQRYATYRVGPGERLTRSLSRLRFAPLEVLDEIREQTRKARPVRKVALAARVGHDRTVVVLGPPEQLRDVHLEWLSLPA